MDETQDELKRRREIAGWAAEFRRLSDDGEEPEKLLEEIGVLASDEPMVQAAQDIMKRMDETKNGGIASVILHHLAEAAKELEKPEDAAVQCQIEFRTPIKEYAMQPGAVMATQWPGIFRLLTPGMDADRQQIVVEQYFHAHDVMRFLTMKKVDRPSIITPGGNGTSRIYGPQG